MKKVNDYKVKGEMLTKNELLILRSGGSPWPNTTAPKKPYGGSTKAAYSSIVE